MSERGLSGGGVRDGEDRATERCAMSLFALVGKIVPRTVVPVQRRTELPFKLNTLTFRVASAVRLLGCSTASVLVTRAATKRSIVHNARRGIAPQPCAWSIEMGQCLGTRPPPGAVSPSRSRDQEAARSNRREDLSSVPVTSQWCAQEAADQAARTP